MRKYLNLRINDFRKLELQGQSQVDLNWKTIGEFESLEQLVKFAIKYKRQLVENINWSVLYDTNSYGLFLKEDDEKLYDYYMKGKRVLD